MIEILATLIFMATSAFMGAGVMESYIEEKACYENTPHIVSAKWKASGHPRAKITLLVCETVKVEIERR